MEPSRSLLGHGVGRSSLLLSSAHAAAALFLLALVSLTLLASTYRPRLPHHLSTSPSGACNPASPLDCSDPELFHRMMRAAIDAFPDVHFSRFGRPSPGDPATASCDMAWRARSAASGGAKGAAADATYKDYRRFVISRDPATCAYSVVTIGAYHSGPNARKRRGNATATAVATLPPPAAVSEGDFTAGKYLAYAGGGDRCKPMGHYLRSLLCAIAEAQYLNRTLVLDLSLCLPPGYASAGAAGMAEEGKHFRFYFDVDHLKSEVDMVDERQFWADWVKWGEKGRLGVRLAEDPGVTPMKLSRAKETLVIRKFGDVEPGNYWYSVCEGKAEAMVRLPWRIIRRAPSLMNIASAIVLKMNGDFDSVRIVQNEAALQKIQEDVDVGRHVYVAGKEVDMALVDVLRGRYNVHYLNEFEELWGMESEWYMEMKKLNSGVPVEFDGYMREMVDKEVFLKGKKKVEVL